MSRERLQGQVASIEAGLCRLANGFLDAPANDALRVRLSPSSPIARRIAANEFHQELLSVVYRFLVLAVMADRRDMDCWQSFCEHWREVFGCAVLPAPMLDDCSLADEDLNQVVQELNGLRDHTSQLDIEQLGSSYENLLRLKPSLKSDVSGQLVFDLVSGTGRKETGSYYTPPELVEQLIESTLIPVIHDRLSAATVEEVKSNESRIIARSQAILSIRVCDPACGSGHFLLAAGRRLALELARIRTGDNQPTAEPLRAALGDVLSHCLYGVDKHPIAVDLCRISLWLESQSGRSTLASLQQHVRCGDALLCHWPREFPEADAAGGFDVILGNPPWVSYTGRQKVVAETGYVNALIDAFPAIARWPAAHSAFLTLSARLVASCGRVGLVLPKQVAELAAYGDVRAAVTERARLAAPVSDVGEQAFPGVTQPVGLFTLISNTRGQSDREPWPCAPLAISPGNFPLSTRSGLDRLVDQVASFPRFEPKTFSDPGVHTGNVSKKLIVNRDPKHDSEFALIREGRDISAFACSEPKKRLWTTPRLEADEYCRIGALSRYRETPILLRQTANRPIAARHAAPHYFRNSLLACRGVEGVPHDIVLAYLNSALFAWLHRQRTLDANQRTFPQVKIAHLQALPAVPVELLTEHFEGEQLGEALQRSVLEAESSAAGGRGPAPEVLLRLERLVLASFVLPVDVAPQLLEAANG